MSQETLDRALAILRDDEGVRPHAYDDATGERVRAPKGHLTIGCGINLDVGLDRYEIDLLERHRMREGMMVFARDAATLGHGFRVGSLPEDAQLALGLMVFQLGPDTVIEFHRMLDAIRREDWRTAAAEALASHWFQETPRRARRVAGLFLGLARPSAAEGIDCGVAQQ